MKLSNQEFLDKLGQLFTSSQEHGSVYLHQKRLTVDPSLETKDSTYSVLFRATDGKSDKSQRTKISTVVTPDQLEQFWPLYFEIVKSGMAGLRRKEKKKKKAKRAEKEKSV